MGYEFLWECKLNSDSLILLRTITSQDSNLIKNGRTSMLGIHWITRRWIHERQHENRGSASIRNLRAGGGEVNIKRRRSRARSFPCSSSAIGKAYFQPRSGSRAPCDATCVGWMTPSFLFSAKSFSARHNTGELILYSFIA